MHEKSRLIIVDKINAKLLETNNKIEELSCLTDVVSPEIDWGDMITFKDAREVETSQRQLKFAYRKKRKLLNFLEHTDNVNLFLCMGCGKEIDIERLITMPKARLCDACIDTI